MMVTMTVKEMWKKLAKLDRSSRICDDDDDMGEIDGFLIKLDRERRDVVAALVMRCRDGTKARERALQLADRWMP